MMQTKDIKDYIKSATAVTDPSGLMVLLANAQGESKKISFPDLSFKTLSDNEPGGSIMSLREFTAKYITGKPVGTILTDPQHYYASSWYVKVSNNLSLRTQEYAILVTKNAGNIMSSYSTVGLIFLPASPDANAIYFIKQTTEASSTDYSSTVYRIVLTAV